MSSYLPRSDADRFWATVTATTIVALVWLIVAVGPEAAIAPRANDHSAGAHTDGLKPVAAQVASERGSVRPRAIQHSIRARVAGS
jgi:hypothetical protein